MAAPGPNWLAPEEIFWTRTSNEFHALVVRGQSIVMTIQKYRRKQAWKITDRRTNTTTVMHDLREAKTYCEVTAKLTYG